MEEPTESDFEITFNTLDWYKEYLEDNEPQAKEEIVSLGNVLHSLPQSIEELED